MSAKKKTVKKVLITLGPTREYFDPVRFLSNRSTGALGFEIAKKAIKEGHEVTILKGPVCPPQKLKATIHDFVSARDLLKLMKREIPKHDVLYMTAAVCDYKPQKPQAHKKTPHPLVWIGYLLSCKTLLFSTLLFVNYPTL